MGFAEGRGVPGAAEGKAGMIAPRAISTRSATTADAVGPAPAPGPSKRALPIRSPSATTALKTPSTRAMGAASRIMQGCTRWVSAGLAGAGYAQELDPVAELDGEADVERADVADALDVDRVVIDRAAEHDAGEDRELVRGIDPVDVGGRVGLRITQLLRLLEHGGEVPRLAGLHGLVHRRHDVVAGAVQDAVDAADAVAREAPRGAP